MRKYMILVITVFLFSIADAEDVSGNVNGYWTIENSPYNMIGDVFVPENDSLIIEPGVEIIGAAGYQFEVEGYILKQ